MSLLARLFPGSRSRRTGLVRARLRGLGRHEEGIGLIEVVIAFAILMAVLVPTATLLSNVIGQSASARERLTALSLAEQWIEVLNNTPLPSTGRNTTTATSLPKTNTSILQKSGTVRSTVAYSIYAEFTWAPAEGSNPDLCTSSLAPKLLDLAVTVTWNPDHKITDTTIINYPPPGLPKNGFLAVQVNGDPATNPPLDASSRPWKTRVQSVPVTISSRSTATHQFTSGTLHPNQYGCVFEEVPLPPGKYKVSVADPTGATPSWVANDDEATSETQSTLIVTTGQVTTVTFAYDEGSLVDLQYPSTTATEGGVTCPGEGSIVCVVTGQAPADATKPASTPTAELSVRTPTGWKLEHPSGITRVAGVACARSVRCIAVGYHESGGVFTGASVSSPTSAPNFTADTVPSGVVALDGIVCPSSADCYAWGQGSSGVVILSAVVSTSGVTWTTDTGLTGISSVSDVVCPAASTCYAVAEAASGPAILSLGSASAWSTDTLPTTPAVTGLTQLACPGTATCYALGSTSGGAAILSLKSAGTATAWSADTLPTTPVPTNVSEITCPSASTCYVIGTKRSGVTVSGAVLSVATATKWSFSTLTTAVTDLSDLTCPTSTACFAVGSKASAPSIVSRSTPGSWAVDSVPSADSVSTVSCITVSSAVRCFALGTATSGGLARAVIFSRATGISWNLDTLLTGPSPVWFSGVGCDGAACVAAGASETGAVYLTGAPDSTTWKDATSAVTLSAAAGMYLADTPISVSNPNLSPASTIEVTAPAADASRIGPLFPFASGYSVAAAECPSEVASASAAVSSVPGGTSKAKLPMGLLPVEVVTSKGSPVAGATVTAAISDPTCVPLTPLSGSNPASFGLETTGAFGLSELAVIYDTYKVTVTAGGRSRSATVKVTPTETIATTVSEPLPAPVRVVVT